MEHSEGSGKNTKFKKGEQANSASVETIPNGDKIRWAKRSVKNIVHICLRIMLDAVFKDLHFRNNVMWSILSWRQDEVSSGIYRAIFQEGNHTIDPTLFRVISSFRINAL